MTKTIKLITVLFASLLIFGTSCNKYEDGPKISFRSKKARITNTWKVVSATDADDDVTAGYAGLTWTIKEDGTYTTGGSTSAAAGLAETGTWEFNDKKNKLIITIPPETLPRKWTITRLKNDELWLKNKQANGTYKTRKLEGQD
jgi:hypothetical protein